MTDSTRITSLSSLIFGNTYRLVALGLSSNGNQIEKPIAVASWTGDCFIDADGQTLSRSCFDAAYDHGRVTYEGGVASFESESDADASPRIDGRAELAAQFARLIMLLVCIGSMWAMGGCVSTSPDGPGAFEFASEPARNRQLGLTALMAVDTAQTVNIGRSPCLHEANPVAAAVFGSKRPSPQTVLITNTLYIGAHWMLGSYLDRKAESSIDLSLTAEQDIARRSRWRTLRGIYQFATSLGHGFAVSSNTRKGIHPFSTFNCGDAQ